MAVIERAEAWCANRLTKDAIDMAVKNPQRRVRGNRAVLGTVTRAVGTFRLG